MDRDYKYTESFLRSLRKSHPEPIPEDKKEFVLQRLRDALGEAETEYYMRASGYHTGLKIKTTGKRRRIDINAAFAAMKMADEQSRAGVIAADRMAREEAREDIEQALVAIGDTISRQGQRQWPMQCAVLMATLDGESETEIANELGVDRNVVYQWKRRATKRVSDVYPQFEELMASAGSRNLRKAHHRPTGGISHKWWN